MLGAYYLESMFSSKKMDEHIPEMLTDDWELLSTGSTPGDGRVIGPWSSMRP